MSQLPNNDARTLPDSAQPSGSSRWGSPRPVILGLLLLAGAVVLPLFRQAGVPSWRTIWAEDGFEYFQQAHDYGGLAVLLRGYSGYLQLPPRLLAIPATWVPLNDLAVYFAVTGCLVSALLGWFIYWACGGWVKSGPVRVALASLIVLMPALGIDNTADVVNTIWAFAAVAPWAILSLRERPVDVTLRSIVVFLAATSTAVCFLFLPLAIGWGLVRKTRAAWIVVTSFCTGLILQGLVVLHTKNIHYPIPASVAPSNTASGVAHDLGVQVFAMFLFGNKGVGNSQLLAVGATVGVVIIVTVLVLYAQPSRRVIAGVLVAYAVVSFVAPVWNRGASSPQYSVVSVFLLASAVAVLVESPSSPRGQWVFRIAKVLLVAQIIVVTVVCFRVFGYRSEGPNWASSMESTSETQCVMASPNKEANVPTDVYRFWIVELPCRDLPMDTKPS